MNTTGGVVAVHYEDDRAALHGVAEDIRTGLATVVTLLTKRCASREEERGVDECAAAYVNALRGLVELLADFIPEEVFP